jgi:Ca2+-binding RTX toxin-like protein
VQSLNFSGGDSVTLNNDGSIGTVTYNPGSATSTHTITVAPGTTEGTLTVLSSDGIHVDGAASSSDGIQINSVFNLASIETNFLNASTGGITLHSAIGNTVLKDVEYVNFVDATDPAHPHTQTVRIVGAGGYANLSEATAAASTGDVIYVTDAKFASGATDGVINHSGLSIYIANGDGAVMTLSPNLNGAEVRIYGNHSFDLTGTSGNDTIHDYTNIAASATNIIHGGDGNDSIVAHNNTLGTEMIYGDGGSDTLVGGANAQLFGGDGADTLLAYGGAAALSGGAGNDVLLNSYAANSTAKAVTMIGGSGNDSLSGGAGDDRLTGGVRDAASAAGFSPVRPVIEVRGRCALFGGNAPGWATAGTCAVHAVMLQAEKAMRDALAAQTLGDVASRFGRKAPETFFSDFRDWAGDRQTTRTARIGRPRRDGPS